MGIDSVICEEGGKITVQHLSDTLQIGKAGEYMVCADLIMKGFVAYPSEQGLPYDVVLDKGGKLYKVQVKTCLKPRIIPQRKAETYSYIFDLSRRGVSNRGVYSDDDVDLFALVALDVKMVGYIKKEDFRKNLTFRVDSMRGSYYDEQGIRHYERVMELRKSISNQHEIARQTGLDVSAVNRMCKSGYVPHKTDARYLSDIVRDRGWFDD